jgi:hypothetical protein
MAAIRNKPVSSDAISKLVESKAKELFQKTAGPDGKLDAKEKKTLTPFLQEIASRNKNADSFARGVARAAIVNLNYFDNKTDPRDMRLYSQLEIGALKSVDPTIGKLAQEAYDDVNKRGVKVPSLPNSKLPND